MTYRYAFLLLGALLLPLAGCGEDDPSGGPGTTTGDLATALKTKAEIVLGEGKGAPTTAAGDAKLAIEGLAEAFPKATQLGAIEVDYPHDGSVFPPDFVPPTLLWQDETEGVDAWMVEFAFADGGTLRALVPGPRAPKGETDPEAFGPTNEPYVGTPRQRSARSWRPSPEVWAEVKQRSREQQAVVSIVGFAVAGPTAPLSRGQLRLMTSKDPVGAPVFYRDVPLMPAVGKKGTIQPLGEGAIPLIRWRLKDLSRDDSRVVLREMPTCANCHSFSMDGKTMGMDVDGPQGDKGSYLISPIEKDMVVEKDEVISWNDFKEKPKGHKTIGFLTQVSPEGRYALTTLNEKLYVANFPDYKFLQVFYPTGGILAYYDSSTKEMKALPGADDPEFAHTNGVWSPDGKTIVFSRAKAFDPQQVRDELAEYPNDPREPPIQYDLYRMPFNEGKGGKAVPIEGASANGMSNTFPKVSPDGKWIVYTKCKNGQLMRPDGRLWIVPFEGGEAREMECNTSLMNSWHSFSPNSRWMVFSSKVNTPYTQMFLTHIDEDGNSTPPVLVPNATVANRAVNIPEFLNASYDDMQEISIPAVNHVRLVRRGFDLLTARKPREAIAAFEQAKEYDSTMHRIYAGLGHCHAVLNNVEEALANLRKSLEIYEEAPLVHTTMGTLLSKIGQPEEGLVHLKRAVYLSPGLFTAHKNLGLLLLQLGRPREAVPYLIRALQLNVEDVHVHRALANIYLGSTHKDYKEGVAHLKDVLKLEPSNVQERTRLAWVLSTCPDATIRNGQEALDLAQRAVKDSQGRRPEPLDALAAAFAEMGRFPDAVNTIDRALGAAKQVNEAMIPGLQERRRLYQRNKPYREQ